VYPKIQEIRDYKLTHTAAHTSTDQHESWDKQLNTLGFLLGLKGIKIKMGVIVAVFRDWSKNQYRLAKIPDKDGNVKDYPMPEEQYEFHGSGSLIPEPIIRILYEWLIIKLFGEAKGYDKKLGDAFNAGYLSRNDVLDAESQINQIKKVYPEMFGERR